MHRFLLPFLFGFVFQLLPAQSQEMQAGAIFLEAGGTHPYYALGYQGRLFATKNTTTYLRLGASIWGDGISGSVGASVLMGKGQHHPELILAITPYSEGARFWDRAQSDVKLDLVLGLGYRYQTPDKPFFLSAGAFPYLRLDPTANQLSESPAQLLFRPGVAAGWLFGKR